MTLPTSIGMFSCEIFGQELLALIARKIIGIPSALCMPHFDGRAGILRTPCTEDEDGSIEYCGFMWVDQGIVS